jgi:hypothetical protein
LPENFFVPLRCLIVMTLGELKVWGVRLALGDCEVDEALGERDGLAEVAEGELDPVGELDGDVPAEAEPVGEPLGLRLADADALGLRLADGLALVGHAGSGNSPQVGMGGTWARAEVMASLLRLASTGDSAASITTQVNRATRACLRALLRPSSSRGIEHSLPDRRL